MDGPSLGLVVKDRVVIGIHDPGATRLGFRVGQRVEAVNGVAVCTNDQLMAEMRKAMGPFKASGAPMYFDVSPDAAAARRTAAGGSRGARGARSSGGGSS